MKGFYVIKKDGKYYKARGEYTDDIDAAYTFIVKYLAERLAQNIGGEVEML